MSKKPDRPKDMLAHLSEIKSAPSAASAPDSATGAGSAPIAPSAIYKKHGVEIRKEYLEKLKNLAYWQRRRLRDLLDDALGEYLETHAETHEREEL
jgi:hypothetical protein